MKTPLLLAAGTCAALTSAHASILLGFDGLGAGSAANSAAPANAQFTHAVFDYDYDATTGDPLPGTLRWRTDATAPEVIVEDPSTYGRGAAPSPNNALNALWQPVLLTFQHPFDLVSFGATLDNDTYGDDGTQPGFDDIAVRFLDLNGAILSSIPVNQTQPGFQVSAGGIAGVAAIVLPGGAFYDNLTWAPVPEPSQWAGIAGLGLLGFTAWRRQARTQRG